MPTPLVVKNGFEDAVPGLGIHSMAGIADGQPHIRSESEFGMGSREFVVELHDIQIHFERPSVLAHGEKGVSAQIHKDLVNLGRIGKHSTAIRVDVLAELDRGRQGRAEKFQRLGDDECDLDRFALRLTPSTKCQNLIHELFGAFAGADDVLNVGIGAAFGRGVSKGHVRVAEDGSQNVIEIVSDAARQRSDSFHLLRMAQLCLQSFLRLPGAPEPGDYDGQ